MTRRERELASVVVVAGSCCSWCAACGVAGVFVLWPGCAGVPVRDTESGCAVTAHESRTVFRWEADPEYVDAPVVCPECGSACEALRVEPDRSEAYVTHIHLCAGEGCRRAWPYFGARALHKVGKAA